MALTSCYFIYNKLLVYIVGPTSDQMESLREGPRSKAKHFNSIIIHSQLGALEEASKSNHHLPFLQPFAELQWKMEQVALSPFTT